MAKPTYKDQHWLSLLREVSNHPWNFPPRDLHDWQGCRGYYLNGGTTWDVRIMLNRQPIVFARFPLHLRSQAAKMADIAMTHFSRYHDPERRRTPRFNFGPDEASLFVEQEPEIVNLLTMMELHLLSSGEIVRVNPKDPVVYQSLKTLKILAQTWRQSVESLNWLCSHAASYPADCAEYLDFLSANRDEFEKTFGHLQTKLTEALNKPRDVTTDQVL